MKQFASLADAQTLALAIVDTIPEPFLVLDEEFRIMAASRCFYEQFQVDPAATRGCLLYDVADGAWDIPALRMLLETIIAEHKAMEGFEVEHEFRHLGQRTMLLNARLVHYDDAASPTILLAFKDITERREVELEKQALLERTEELLCKQMMLLSEMQHRVANSLQIIASILLLKAKSVSSEETRNELKDAHKRVISVAAVQSHLHPSDGIQQIDVRSYLTKLCASLSASMIGEERPISIKVHSSDGTIESSKAVSIGLIVTELVINAIKYAYPLPTADARIHVDYRSCGEGWTLSISDNGIGKTTSSPHSGSGLGTAIVAALSRQLGAEVRIMSGPLGLSVAIQRAGTAAMLPKAA
jgi:two-component sensor histidine kinase